jgi:hypothetical protein
LRPLVVTGEPGEAEEPDGPQNAAFELNTLYQVDDDGRLGRQLRRKVERQIAELQAENEQEELLEAQMANAQLPPEIAQDLQEEHESHVGLQAAQMAADANRSDAAAAAAEIPRMYVKRGSRHYVEIHRTKLKPGEPVFTKERPAALTNASAQPTATPKFQISP